MLHTLGVHATPTKLKPSQSMCAVFVSLLKNPINEEEQPKDYFANKDQTFRGPVKVTAQVEGGKFWRRGAFVLFSRGLYPMKPHHNPYINLI